MKKFIAGLVVSMILVSVILVPVSTASVSYSKNAAGKLVKTTTWTENETLSPLTWLPLPA